MADSQGHWVPVVGVSDRPLEVGEDPEALALAEVVGAEPSTVYPCRHPEHPKEAGASASSGCRGVES